MQAPGEEIRAVTVFEMQQLECCTGDFLSKSIGHPAIRGEEYVVAVRSNAPAASDRDGDLDQGRLAWHHSAPALLSLKPCLRKFARHDPPSYRCCAELHRNCESRGHWLPVALLC